MTRTQRKAAKTTLPVAARLSEKLDQAVATFAGTQVYLNAKAVAFLGIGTTEINQQNLSTTDFIKLLATCGRFDSFDEEAVVAEISQSAGTELAARTTERWADLFDVDTIHDDQGHQAWLFRSSEPRRHLPGCKRQGKSGDYKGPTETNGLADLTKQLAAPINAINGMARLMLKSNPAEKQRLYCDVIAEYGSELAEVMTSLQELMSLKAEQEPHISELTDLGGLLGSQRPAFENAAKEKNIELRFRFSHTLPKLVEVNCAKLERLLSILIDNAVKFTDFGRITVSAEDVTCASGGERGKLMFTIADTGCGIQKTDIEAVFEPFIRLSPPSGAEQRGAGFGLAIARVLADQLDATLTMSSKVPSGTKVTITLPYGIQISPSPQSMPRETQPPAMSIPLH